MRPQENEYAHFYAGYVKLVPEERIIPVLERQVAELRSLLARVTDAREQYRYADGKWSIREVVAHMIDAERVFGFRAFCFSRGETAELPSFDEGSYVANGGGDGVVLEALLSEFEHVRAGNVAFLDRLAPAGWGRIGVANGNPVSVRAIAWMMAGHVRHHSGVLREKYGV